MAPKIYEIKLVKDGREVRDLDPYLTGLDLEEAETTTNRLNRHLLGAVQRSGGRRDQAHMYQLEVRDTIAGKGAGKPLFRWALPAAEDI
jgi:hypothetical protein